VLILRAAELRAGAASVRWRESAVRKGTGYNEHYIGTFSRGEVSNTQEMTA